MIAWIAANLLWSSLLMLLVLAVRRPTARLLGAGTAYALWLLPAVRLVLPPLPAIAAGLPLQLPPLDLGVAVEGTAASLPPQGGPGQWEPWLLAIWAGGAAVFLVWQWRLYRDFLARLSLTSRALGSVGDVPLVESSAVPGPLAIGLLDRRIVVPADFLHRYAADERRLALAHEQVHHRRGDIWCNIAALAILALNWFNPIAWLAFRAFREDQELACDAAVAAQAGDRDRLAYAQALVKSASRPGLIAVCPLNHANQLKRRLRMLNDHRPSRLRTLGGSVAIAAFGGLAVLLGSPGIAHPHPDGDEGSRRQQRIIIMDRQSETAGGEGGAHVRQFALDPDGEVPRECDQGSQVADVDENDGGRRTRILLCSREGGDPAQRVQALQRARERLAQNEHLADGHRQRVLEALDREIARAGAQ